MRTCRQTSKAIFVCFQNLSNDKFVLFEASDRDNPGQLTFSVSSEDGQQDVSGWFEMTRETSTSSWLAIKNLDYETQTSYRLKIQVQVLSVKV